MSLRPALSTQHNPGQPGETWGARKEKYVGQHQRMVGDGACNLSTWEAKVGI